MRKWVRAGNPERNLSQTTQSLQGKVAARGWAIQARGMPLAGPERHMRWGLHHGNAGTNLMMHILIPRTSSPTQQRANYYPPFPLVSPRLMCC